MAKRKQPPRDPVVIEPPPLTVVSPTYYEDKTKCRYLEESAEILGYKLHLYGIGKFFSTLREAKIISLVEEVQKVETDLVLVCDSVDTLLVEPQKELVNRFLAKRCLLLMAAEKQCYPQPLMAECYPKITSPWRYLNSGAYIGDKVSVAAMLEEALKLRPHPANVYRSRDWENDQFLFAQLYIQGFGITLDTDCYVFQCVGDITEEEYKQAAPCLYHFNGHAAGIEKEFEKRFGKLYVAETAGAYHNS